MDLRQQTKFLVKREKHYTALILKNLARIEDDKLYCEYGHPNLFKYLTRELGYSESEAATRVAAVRLVLRKKNVTKKIESGDLSLTNAAQVNNAIGQYEKETGKIADDDVITKAIESSEGRSSREAKEELREQLELKTPRTEKIILNDKILAKFDRVRKIYGSLSTLEILDILLEEKLKAPTKPLLRKRKGKGEENEAVEREMKSKSKSKLKVEAKAKSKENDKNKNQGVSAGAIVGKVAGRVALKTGRPQAKPLLRHRNAESKSVNLTGAAEATQTGKIFAKNRRCGGTSAPECPASDSRYISAAVKYEQYHAYDGACANCGTRRDLHYDHINEFARGGDSSADNIQILCANCNQRKAIVAFGKGKFGKYGQGGQGGKKGKSKKGGKGEKGEKYGKGEQSEKGKKGKLL